MSRIFQGIIFQLVIVIVLFAGSGCNYDNGAAKPAAESSSLWQPMPPKLISPKALADTDLDMVWQSELPIKQGETFEKLYIIGDRIYVLSSRNFLTALDRSNGAVIFGKQLGEPGFAVIGLDQYQDDLFALESFKLHDINIVKGTDVRTTDLGFTASCPAARNGLFYYIAGTDKRIRALRAADMTRMFEVAADDSSDITSIVADETFVIFTTDTGLCVSFAADSQKQLWKFSAEGGIVAPMVKEAESIFFASKDTSVYRFEAATGKFVWKCPLGAIPEQGPDVTQKCVYQYTTDKGLTVIDRGTGKILWRLPEGVKLIAEAGDKTYVASNTGGIKAVEGQNTKVTAIRIPSASRYAVNVVDSKIYIADNAGRIACLKPVK